MTCPVKRLDLLPCEALQSLRIKEREVLLRGVGTSTISFSSKCICEVAAWWFDNPHQQVLGAGFLGAPRISLIGAAVTTQASGPSRTNRRLGPPLSAVGRSPKVTSAKGPQKLQGSQKLLGWPGIVGAMTVPCHALEHIKDHWLASTLPIVQHDHTRQCYYYYYYHYYSYCYSYCCVLLCCFVVLVRPPACAQVIR